MNKERIREEGVGEDGYVELALSREKKVKALIRKIPLEDLKLDTTNVRFHHLPGKLTDKEIEKRIWKEPDTKNLYREVIFSGGLTEPPYVDQNNIVREGNRRIVCMRVASKRAHDEEPKGFKQDHFDLVTCFVLPADMPSRDLSILLARVHVSGKKEWAALNKASYIYDLYNKHGMPLDDIRESLSMGKAQVLRMINAFEATHGYGSRYPGEKDNWLQKYSYFDELYKKPTLKEWAKEDDNLSRFMEWIHEGKIASALDVRRLPSIIADDEAMKAQVSGGVQEAQKVLIRKDPSIDNKTYNAIKRATEVLDVFPRKELEVAGHDPIRLEMIENLRDKANTVLQNIQAITSGEGE